ncbi:MAG: hypothetical protein R3B45_12010 [Bdellovibrionota bacterium]
MENLSEQELFLSHIVEYMDDNLPNEIANKVSDYGKKNEAEVEKFQKIRGELQFSLQSLYLSEDELLEIRRYIRNEEERHNMDELRIVNIEKKERWTHWRRQLGFILMTLAIILIAIYVLSPPPKTKFDALQSLVYEAMSNEENTSADLHLPSDDLQDIKDFFDKNPQFQEKPKVLGPLENDWKVDGVSIIDYDIAKIAMVRYSNKELGESIFHFTYQGNLSDLEKSQQGNIDGFTYQAYASDKMNIIAWQSSEHLVSMIIGHRATDELAKLAIGGGAQQNPLD